jgi:hypothetical protein
MSDQIVEHRAMDLTLFLLQHVSTSRCDAMQDVGTRMVSFQTVKYGRKLMGQKMAEMNVTY